MEEFNVNTPEGLRRFLLAEAELDEELHADSCLRQYLNENKLETNEYCLMIKCLGSIEA